MEQVALLVWSESTVNGYIQVSISITYCTLSKYASYRRVVECGPLVSDCFVEVYLLKLKMCVHPHLENVKTRKFSRADTVGEYRWLIDT